MTARRRLIVAADDFGMSPGVNAGILCAHREGILTETSLMVRGAAVDEAVALARATPSLGVGLHLTLLQGHCTAPANEIPLLVDADGRFSDNPVWTGMRYFFVPGIRAQLRREITAQLDAFAATGLPLSHVDGHLTIHMHPNAIAVLLEVAERYRVRALRVPRDPLAAALRWDRRHAARKLFEGIAFGSLARWAAPRIAAGGLRMPDRMFGMHQTGAVTEDYLLHLIATLAPGTSEVYCHPAATVDDEALRWRPADYHSDAELAALCSPRVRAAIDASGIELIGYRDL
ncbi:MAG TPA: hopanoid biosynthesis-associated protein HpnK [Candidatus Dormibacteraeota bacterium]|nr:hopanoid biosynthesis-associated protein HpnK [Candidatus Dormibacteraeota bacterium]